MPLGNLLGELVVEAVADVDNQTIYRRFGLLGCAVASLVIAALVAGLIWLVWLIVR